MSENVALTDSGPESTLVPSETSTLPIPSPTNTREEDEVHDEVNDLSKPLKKLPSSFFKDDAYKDTNTTKHNPVLKVLNDSDDEFETSSRRKIVNSRREDLFSSDGDDNDFSRDKFSKKDDEESDNDEVADSTVNKKVAEVPVEKSSKVVENLRQQKFMGNPTPSFAEEEKIPVESLNLNCKETWVRQNKESKMSANLRKKLFADNPTESFTKEVGQIEILQKVESSEHGEKYVYRPL